MNYLASTFFIALTVDWTVPAFHKIKSFVLIDSLSEITNFKLIINVLPKNDLIPMSFMTSPAGAFIVLGILMALFNKGGKHESN